MDSSLTGTAGLITKNLYPPLARLVRRKPLEGKPLMRMTQAVNLMLGGWAILISYLFYIWGGSASIYEIGLKIVVLVSAPMVMAFALSFFIPWLPRWGPLVGMAFGFVASAIFMFTKDVAGWYPDWVWLQSFAADVRSLQWHQQMYISTGVVLGSTALTALFWKYEPKEYAERVDKFFTNLRTPVNFDQEVGESQDGSLLRMIGILGLCMAAAIGILFFLAEDHAGRMSVLFIVLSIGLVSAFMTWRGYRSHPGDGIAALGAGVSPADGDEKEAVMAADETDEQR